MSKQIYLTQQQFSEWVHEALNHLYDSSYLQSHPLVNLLLDEEEGFMNHSQPLRRLLLDAIHRMRPGPGVPAQAPDWRAYKILELRYIEGLPPGDVMERIALSKSQYFREQARILEAVTLHLWEQWQQRASDSLLSLDLPTAGLTVDAPRKELARLEAERMCMHAVWEEVDVGQLLQVLFAFVKPLALAKGVMVHLESMGYFTVSHVDRVLLRQAVLNVISYGLDIPFANYMTIERLVAEHKVGIFIRVRRFVFKPGLDEQDPGLQRQGIGTRGLLPIDGSHERRTAYKGQGEQLLGSAIGLANIQGACCLSHRR